MKKTTELTDINKDSDEINTIAKQIDQAPGNSNYRTGYNMDSSKFTDKNYLKILESKYIK
jgi:hypothetical protein